MTIRSILIVLILFVNSNLNAQENKPIWDIGTKWTYEFNWVWDSNDTFDYAIIEIVDTITIDALKLYKVERVHSTCNSTFYLYYSSNKVFNYDINNKTLQLLYDFDDPEDYITKYRINCNYNPELENLVVDLPIIIDSIGTYIMPDGTLRKVQYLTAIDTFRSDSSLYMNHSRTVVEGIGFMQGQGYHTHEWSIDGYFCDQWTCFPKHLRCFQNDSILYNFVGFPCDSTFTSNVDELRIKKLEVYPNPTFDSVRILSDLKISRINLSTVEGKLIIDRNYLDGESIQLPKQGVYILKAKVENKWLSRKIVRMR